MNAASLGTAIQPALGGVIRRAHTSGLPPAAAIRALRDALGDTEFSMVALFLSPIYYHPDTAKAINEAFGRTPVIGCTTAGEITPEGLTEGAIVAIGFPADLFTATHCLVSEDFRSDAPAVAEMVLDQLSIVAMRNPDWDNDFAFLLNDGLAQNEDRLVALINPALGTVPLFGGSAGDGLDFRSTAIFANGRFHRNTSVLTVFRTRCPVKVFRIDHFKPTATRMVVTGADPDNRLVSEINAEPAAAEYARMVGKDPKQLSPFIFAAHPVMVQVGGEYHVRAIQKIEPNGELRFFSAIDEGLVLTVAESDDIVSHLDRELVRIAGDHPPDAIIGCECILRRLEVEQTQASQQMSEVMRRHKVVGFNTYGEQFNMLHVNQTLTGVAIYAPPKD